MNSQGFNIKLVQDKNNKDTKWIVWGKNVGKKMFVNIFPFKVRLFDPTSANNIITGLSQDSSNKEEEKWTGASNIVKSDLIRKFTIEEYMMLSQLLTYAKYKYNKKTDSFIKF